ncbi:hypothetical protein [Allorhodopirellula solitaria]|nr:hypothetical protein [Allorhodopirellula solitaria]
MKYREKAIAVVLCTALACNQGCMSIKKQDAVSSQTQPVAYRSDVPGQAKSDGILGKTKSAIATTGKAIGVGVLLVGFFVAKIWLDDDEDEEGYDPDPLWRQGYGFNNPNNERIKNGEPVLNFDGSVAD